MREVRGEGRKEVLLDIRRGGCRRTGLMFRRPLPEPVSNHDQLASDDDHAENDFVVPG
jgi:hypothetical protein